MVVSAPGGLINYCIEELRKFFQRHPSIAEIFNYVKDNIADLINEHPKLSFAIIGALIGSLIGWISAPLLATGGAGFFIAGGASLGAGAATGYYARSRLFGNSAISVIANAPAHQNISQDYIQQRLISNAIVLQINFIDLSQQLINRFRTNQPLAGILADILEQPFMSTLHLTRPNARQLAHSITGALQDDVNKPLDSIIGDTMETDLVRNIGLEDAIKRQVIEEACLICIYISRKADQAIQNIHASSN